MSLFGLSDILLRPKSAWNVRPDHPALIFDHDVVTYGELAARVRSLCAGLVARGFAAGDVVGILLKNRPEYFEWLFAVSHLGGTVVPINYLLRAGEVDFILRDSASSWVVTEQSMLASVEETLADVPTIRGVLIDGAAQSASPRWIQHREILRVDGASAPEASVRSDATLLLQYTSGTTGFPKGAVHTHATVLMNALAQVVDFDVTHDDVHLVVPSLSWAAGLHCLTLSVLWRGGTVVINPTGGFDPREVAQRIERHGVTTAMLAPSVLRIMLKAGVLETHDLTSLRLVLSGGEPVSSDEIAEAQRWIPHLDLSQGYGVSEFPSTMAFLNASDVARHQGAAGRSSITANVRVVDAVGADVPVGAHGEIVVRSAQTSLGYHSPDGSARTAVRNGWLHTGDQGYFDDDSYLHVSGRVKEMIVSGGLNVYPAEVERVLLTFPGVAEVAVIPMADERFGQVPHAVVVPEPDVTLDEEALRAFATQHLASFKVPRAWTLRADPLPRTVTGKLRRFELRSNQA